MSDSSTTTESTPAIEVALVAPRLAVCMAISSAYHRSETTHAGRIDLIALAVCASWPSPQPWTRGVIASVAQAEASLRVAQEGAARAVQPSAHWRARSQSRTAPSSQASLPMPTARALLTRSGSLESRQLTGCLWVGISSTAGLSPMASTAATRSCLRSAPARGVS